MGQRCEGHGISHSDPQNYQVNDILSIIPAISSFSFGQVILDTCLVAQWIIPLVNLSGHQPAERLNLHYCNLT